MDEIKRCLRCILPLSLPGIFVDGEGICNYCRQYENDFKNWDEIKSRKEKEFIDLIEKARKLKRPYDVLVPLSCGKDSTFALYLCTKKTD